MTQPIFPVARYLSISTAPMNGATMIPFLFGGYADGNVLPPFAPICRQTFFYTARPLGKQKKSDIAALSDDVPDFISPYVGFFQKKVAGHAHAQLGSAFYFIVPVTVFFQRQVKIVFYPVYHAAVLVPHFVQEKHVAIFTALAVLSASVPRIPDVVHHDPPDGVS